MSSGTEIDGELPEGWRWEKLGDVVTEVRNGIAAKPDAETGTPILRISAVRPMSFNKADVRYLGGSGNDWEAYRLHRNDLLFTRYNGNPALVGVCARIADEPSGPLVYPDKLIRVRVDTSVADAAFIERAVHVGESRDFVDARTKTSAGQVGISGADLKQVPIPIPPLPEQRRIVKKLESLQARSRRAREALDAVPALLDQLRQSILAAAFRGDLTADWRTQHPDVEPASELLKRIRIERRKKWEAAELTKLKAKGKFPTDDKWKQKYVDPEPVDDSELPELPEGWCWASVDEAFSDARIGLVRSASEQGDSGVPYVRMQHYDSSGRWNSVDVTRVRVSPAELQEYALREGDILFNTRNSPELVGKVAVWHGRDEVHVYNNNLMRMRTTGIVSEWLAWQMVAPAFRSRITESVSATTSVAAIYGRDLFRQALALPPFEEQRASVAILRTLLARAETTIASMQELGVQLASLDSAILAKAFRGELVPQDPADSDAQKAHPNSSCPSPTQPRSTRRAHSQA